MDRLKEGSPEYNVSNTLAFRGQPNRKILEKSVNTIISRHQSLRTVFDVEVEDPFQLIATELTIELPLVDLRSFPHEKQQTLIKEAVAVPFDLKTLPLIRSNLYRLDEDEYILSIVIHHIVYDGWSVGVFYRELSACYSAFLRNQEPVLPKLDIQYVDYAKWQKEWLTGAVLQKQLDYWTDTLRGIELLEFPTDRARPSIQTFNGALHKFHFSDSYSDELAAFMTERRITPFMFFLTAFETLLARYSGQDDIVVGTPIANRQREEQEPLIGFFVNTLVMRLCLEEDSSFVDLIQQMRGKILDAFMAQDLPFERLVEEVNPERDRSRHPLFQILFALQNARGSHPGFEGLEEIEPPSNISKTHFDLELHVKSDNGTWAGHLIYNTDLFDHESIQRFGLHLQNLVDAIISKPAQPVKKINFLGEDEEQFVLKGTPLSAEDAKGLRRVDELVDQVSKELPHVPAIQYGEEQIHYQELLCRANGFGEQAHYAWSESE